MTGLPRTQPSSEGPPMIPDWLQVVALIAIMFGLPFLWWLDVQRNGRA